MLTVLLYFLVAANLSMHLTSVFWNILDRTDLTLAISQRFEFIIRIDQSLKWMLSCRSHLSSIRSIRLEIRCLRLPRGVHQNFFEISHYLLHTVKLLRVGFWRWRFTLIAVWFLDNKWHLSMWIDVCSLLFHFLVFFTTLCWVLVYIFSLWNYSSYRVWVSLKNTRTVVLDKGLVWKTCSNHG